MSSKKLTTADSTSLFFIVLYLAGTIYNTLTQNTSYAALWGTLFVINTGLFAYRKLKKK